jgi:hypothetical protein
VTWPCPGCGQQITDLAACGRPIYAELGHAAGCARLARDQAADQALRRDWLPRLILHSEDPVGPVQRHWLAGPIIDDCPRCGWHGYFPVTWSPSTATGPARSVMTAMRT